MTTSTTNTTPKDPNMTFSAVTGCSPTAFVDFLESKERILIARDERIQDSIEATVKHSEALAYSA
jgi:hypothetical protein